MGPFIGLIKLSIFREFLPNFVKIVTLFAVRGPSRGPLWANGARRRFQTVKSPPCNEGPIAAHKHRLAPYIALYRSASAAFVWCMHA